MKGIGKLRKVSILLISLLFAEISQVIRLIFEDRSFLHQINNTVPRVIVAIVFVVLVSVICKKDSSVGSKMVIVLLLAGAISNVAELVAFGGVKDYILLIFADRFLITNVGDIFLIAALLIAVYNLIALQLSNMLRKAAL